MRLDEMVSVLRSKNAGPRILTFDLIFPDEASFTLAAASVDRIGDEVAQRYRVPRQQVATHVYRPALALKISLPRPIMSGDPGDGDVYGAQQHAPLLGIEI